MEAAGKHFQVKWSKKKVERLLRSIPRKVQERFFELVKDLQRAGPYQPQWPHYSALGGDNYHCHLTRDWVACWRSESGSIVIEVYYVGSREGAPY